VRVQKTYACYNVYVQTCVRYNVHVHVQPMHAIMYIQIDICKQTRARYNVYVHVQPMYVYVQTCAHSNVIYIYIYM
jgi:hypothetical protein